MKGSEKNAGNGAPTLLCPSEPASKANSPMVRLNCGSWRR
jgi:hypothetical protein